MSAATILLLLTPHGVTLPVNTSPPTVNPTATIGISNTGTAGTWTGSPVLTYQWQRSLDGVTWVDISGATAINYTPVDADFGYVLRLAEIPDGDRLREAYSAATGRVAEAPTQSLGSELLTNGDFSAWSGDNPTSWTVTGESGSDPMVTQVAPGGGAGTGAARFYSSATANTPRITQAGGAASGDMLLVDATVSAFIAGSLSVYEGGVVQSITFAAASRKIGILRASAPGARIQTAGAAPHDMTLDSVSYKKITFNDQLVAPSADMRISFFYTLPASPIEGDCVWLLPRISDFAAGNYWLGFLRYTGTQWDINLYSVSSHTRISRSSATNVGATDGLRVNMNGNTLTMETHASGAWTQRGSTATNSTYSTATGVNVLYTSTVTPGID